MAMRSCPECLNQIDENASVCPHCGHVLSGDEPKNNSVEVYLEERRWTFGNTLIAVLLVLLIAGLGYLLYIYGLKQPYEDAMKYYRLPRPIWNWMRKSTIFARSSIPGMNRWTSG